jgi:hypothetical protein
MTQFKVGSFSTVLYLILRFPNHLILLYSNFYNSIYRLKNQNKDGELLDRFVLLRLCYVLNFKLNYKNRFCILHKGFSSTSYLSKKPIHI